MIGYVTVGTNQIEKAQAFYDALLGTIGAKRILEFPHGFTLYGTGWGQPGLAVTPPYDKKPATVGNGCMVAMVMDSRRLPRQGARARRKRRRRARPARPGRRPGLLRRLFPRSRRQQVLRLSDRSCRLNFRAG
jgi:hypothetical protein